MHKLPISNMNKLNPIDKSEIAASNPEEDIDFEGYYMNMMQIKANVIDTNVLIGEIARAGGKTEGIMGPRIIRVSESMPGELGYLISKTYVSLLTNIVPNLLSYFSKPVQNGKRPMLKEGIDYIVGASKIPPHFRRPRKPISYPKHSLLFCDGFNWQLVASDQPEAAAGQSGVHAAVEEMKHNNGEKLKTRLFPGLRGSPEEIRKSPYYQGITGVSDTARVDLGEDNWFEEYEKNTNKDLIEEIVTVSLHVNAAIFTMYKIDKLLRQEKNPIFIEKLRTDRQKAMRTIANWRPRLNEMRGNASYYIRASSFVNKDFLGPKFFKTQLDSMEMDEFLTAICAIRRKAVVNKFFANYNPKKHQFGADSYKYNIILQHDLKQHFSLSAKHLTYYDSRDELYVGYDPGHFTSMVVAQKKENDRELRVIKEFYCCNPEQQPALAKQFYDFFGHDSVNKRVVLYPDRAGNKTREEREQITTDSRIMKRELESFGFTVDLMNEGQATVYHWMQFKLLLLLFGEQTHFLPRVLICENECKNLCSAIMLSPLKQTDGRIELDKTSEKKVPLRRQAGLTTQLPSALIYLLFGLYGEQLPKEFSQLPSDLPGNFTT